MLPSMLTANSYVYGKVINLIYRIEFDRAYEVEYGDKTGKIYSILGEWFSERMAEEGLRVPNRFHPRARFWFTEQGWQKVGKKIAEDMNKLGAYTKIKKQKNPKKGDVYWSDPYQVALLSNKRR